MWNQIARLVRVAAVTLLALSAMAWVSGRLWSAVTRRGALTSGVGPSPA